VTIAEVYNNCAFKTQRCGGWKALKTTKLSFLVNYDTKHLLRLEPYLEEFKDVVGGNT